LLALLAATAAASFVGGLSSMAVLFLLQHHEWMLYCTWHPLTLTHAYKRGICKMQAGLLMLDDDDA
jgi:hypothetical protein